ncbi:MAG TPA: ice-binding family protein [Candidatus Saccharimonadales bacterium]|nr:ice-binding family protein [Candidatus Saccharimonadales bacterium]
MKRPISVTTRPLALAVTLVLAGGFLGAGLAVNAASPTAIGLGTAGSFGVLAGAGITNTGPTTINGDVGSYPTTTQTGFGSVTITGTNHFGDAVTQGAKTDLVTAYNDAAGRGPTIPVAANLGGQTLVAGVYNSASSLALTGSLTLSGTASDVWIFQAGSTLTTATGSSVVLTGGAQACNVFWQVGSSATLGTGSSFKGTILALTSITMTTGASIDGRLLARNGAVTLDTDTITRSSCAAAAVATPTPTPTPTPTAAPAAPTATPAAPTATPVAPAATVAPRLPSSSTAPQRDLPIWLIVIAMGALLSLAMVVRLRLQRVSARSRR